MKLTKDEFVEHVEHLLEMMHQSDIITDALDVGESIFDRWIENYYNLLYNCCEFTDEDCDCWDGAPLDFYVFIVGYTKDSDYTYTNPKGKEINFESPEQLYDYIVSLH